jgi:GT2 family glycosyltransferase
VTPTPLLSVVVPARDAGATLGATLDSLRAQTCAQWEAVVVDDGSHDETGAIARRAGADDARVRLLARREAGGVSDARNAGMAAARCGWLLFLDADDTIEPPMLARLLRRLDEEPDADAAHCGWWWTDDAGRPLAEGHADAAADLFPALAHHCVFATTSACLVRADVARRVGGFDPALRTSEDFDFWQRVARAGARFAAVPETFVRYRLRRDASWFRAPRFLRDALTVIARGHAPDPRVADPAPAHAAGAPVEGLPAAALHIATWAAAVALARGDDPMPLLDVVRELVPDLACPTLDADATAATLAFALPLTSLRPAADLPALYDAVAAPLRRWLDALGRLAAAPGIGARTDERLAALAGAAVAGSAPPAEAPTTAEPTRPAERARQLEPGAGLHP